MITANTFFAIVTLILLSANQKEGLEILFLISQKKKQSIWSRRRREEISRRVSCAVMKPRKEDSV